VLYIKSMVIVALLLLNGYATIEIGLSVNKEMSRIKKKKHFSYKKSLKSHCSSHCLCGSNVVKWIFSSGCYVNYIEFC